jgi:HEAT repeat protein
MDDSDAGVRVRILHAASEAGSAAVPALIEALKNEKAAYWACLVLREIGPEAKDAAPALAAKLQDPNPEIRREAALTLGALGDAAIPVVPQLAVAVNDEQTRGAATFALGQIGQMPRDAEAKIQANAASGDKFLSTISYWTLARVHPDDKELRRKATERLVERIMDKDAFVRVAAARALVALPPAPDVALPIWEKALQNADEATIHHAMDALARMGAPAVPRLIDALKHKSMRAQVAHILGEIGPAAAPATEALAKLAVEADARVATEAALALAKIGPEAKAAVPALSAALQQPDSPNAHAIVYALGRIGPGAAAAEPALFAALKSSDRSLAVLSAWALTRLHPPSQQMASRAMPVLLAGLEDALPQSRQAAADALGSLGPLAKEAVGALEKTANDQEPSVREAAAKALRAIAGRGAN